MALAGVYLVAVLVLGACSWPGSGASDGAATTTPRPAVGVTADPEVRKDVAYAPGGDGHLLDLYLPARTGRAIPVVLWTSGSAWMQPSGRSGADFVAAELNPLGWAVAGVAIRPSTQTQFPSQLSDIKAAIRFLKNDAPRYGLDPDKFAVMGESSGGWTAAMAGVTGNVPELEGDVGVAGPSSRVAAVVPFYPPTDFLKMDASMIDCNYFDGVFGVKNCHDDPKSPESLLLGCAIPTCPDKVAQANPVTYLDRDDPPMLILHGTDDHLVPHYEGELLLNAARTACAHAVLISVPGGEHGSWQQWLDGRVAPANATATTAEGCQSSTQPGDAKWATVIDFLRTALAP